MKIAILYICTGKYSSFFEAFYKSAEQFLLKGEEKHYFVWTDHDEIAKDLPNVTLIHRQCQGFPFDTLFRFDMFLQIEDELRKFDYIYFFNSNALLLRPIGKEILPDETGLAMGVWTYTYDKPARFFTYERRPASRAYVAPYGKDYVYYMGGLNGGTAEQYMDMIATLSRNIHDDYDRGIIAVYHDESHINAYMRTHRCKILGREFCLPEEWVKEGEQPKNIFRNKVKVDSFFDKKEKTSARKRFLHKLRKKWNLLRWYIKV